MQKAVVHILGRITSMTRRPVNNFEEDRYGHRADGDAAGLRQRRSPFIRKTIPLVPGTYRLNVIVKDVIAGNMNHYEMRIDVPRLDPRQS